MMGKSSVKLFPDILSPRDSPDSPPYLNITSKIHTDFRGTENLFVKDETEDLAERNNYKSV